MLQCLIFWNNKSCLLLDVPFYVYILRYVRSLRITLRLSVYVKYFYSNSYLKLKLIFHLNLFRKRVKIHDHESNKPTLTFQLVLKPSIISYKPTTWPDSLFHCFFNTLKVIKVTSTSEMISSTILFLCSELTRHT